ncbi:SDR family oxidoreductase [Actinoallomurus sp. CA-150999]|uniref:SDR family oxidoreductase n=1 Tax=Actinoallomurus sp. CA-150999 TaxID=3239887 RepID=UPI003D8F6E6A
MGTYLITGATGGIGSAVAELLHEAGHALILIGRSDDRLAETAARLTAGSGPATAPRTAAGPEPATGPLTAARSDPANAPRIAAGPEPATAPLTANGSEPMTAASAVSEAGGRVRTIALDLSEPLRLEASLADVDMPPLDGLVHSAGAVELGTVAESQPDAWIEQLLVNAAAPAELTRLLLPSLRAARGHVVFVNSGAGLRANPGWGAYAASKHALKALADALRAEEPEIRVTSVYPGRTASEMQRKVRAQEGDEYDPAAFISPGTVATVIVNALTTPRDATVTDVSVRG